MRKVLEIVISLMLVIAFACGCSDAGNRYLDEITGEYEVSVEESSDQNVGEWWHLSIIDDDEYGEYLSIYDVEAGNPGVEGKITSIDDSTITINIDPDLYEQLPTDKWKCDGKTLTLDYAKAGDGIELTNNGTTVKFREN